MTRIRFTPDQTREETEVELDPSQAAVLALADGTSGAVFGAPGSGKTTTIVEFVADRIARGAAPDELLVLSSSRAAATRLRDALALRIDRPTDGPLARTAASLAFELVVAAARAAGAAVPRLLTGADQDADIAALLAGHIESDSGPAWPDPLDRDVRSLRGFRTELRELMGRATEYRITPNGLARRAAVHDRPEWAAAADFIREYLQIVASHRPNQFDSAEFARFAVAAIERGAPDDRVARLRWVLVDDLQDATESTMSILRALAGRGVAIVAFGDPDVASNAFRGGEPDALGRLGDRLGLARVDRFVLSTVYRGSPELRGLIDRVVGRIGTAAGGTQRVARAIGTAPESSDRPALARVTATTPSRHAAAIARILREEHLLHGVGWDELAVIVRSGAAVPELARALARAEVPTRTASSSVPLREDPAARSLLTVIEVAIGRRVLDADAAAELLLGPFGGLDALGLRRLRLALREEELAAGGNRAAGELLVEALSGPGRLATIDTRAGKRAARLADLLNAVRSAEQVTIEDLLWLAWDGSGLARTWEQTALGAGLAASEANRDLDGIVALFAAAKRFVEQRPEADAQTFLEQLLDADVADDLLAPRRSGDAVLVGTPSSVVGAEFRTVVIAALQDGGWPNLRPRGSLLAPQLLARMAEGRDGPIDERKIVLDDELRVFALAASRASERVVLTAVVNDDETLSVLFSLLPDGVADLSATATAVAPLTLRGEVGWLRRVLTSEPIGADLRPAAATSLKVLADAGLPGADPSEWFGLREPSSRAPLFEGDTIPVSPSQIENFQESPLDWIVNRLAGSESSLAMSVGTILHWAMETAPAHDAETLWAAVETRWPELGFESPWLADFQRQATRVLVVALSEYLEDFVRAGKTLIQAEGRFSFPLGSATVSGSIDRVELSDTGEVVIVDLKTGSPQTNPGKIAANAQLGTYQLAYRAGLFDESLAGREHRPGGAKLVYIKSGIAGKRYREGVQLALDEDGLEVFRDLIRSSAARMAAAEFRGPVEPKAYGRRPDAGLVMQRVPEVSHD